MHQKTPIIGNISLPYHLILPGVISILMLSVIIVYRKRLFKGGKWKWFWISTIVFFGIYLLILARASYVDISTQLTLAKLDLNGDGIFSGNEITADQKLAMKTLTNDTGRNLAFITGVVFASSISLIVLLIGKGAEFIQRNRSLVVKRKAQ